MGSSALKARLGWLTLLPLIDEEGKARSWDKCLALAQGRNEKPGASSGKPSSSTSYMHAEHLCSALGLLNDVCFIIYQFHTW